MARLTGIEFNAEFQDDCLWDDDEEEVLRPAGLMLSKTLASLLQKGDIQVSQPEMDVDHYCWHIDVAWLGKRFELQVVQLNTCLVLVSWQVSLSTYLMFWRAPSRANLAERIAEILYNDSRFSDLYLYDIFKRTRLAYRPAACGA